MNKSIDQVALDSVLDLVADWQEKGRTGYCLPVIRGELLAIMEGLVNERRRGNCTVCYGTGKITGHEDSWECQHCKIP